MTKNRTSKLLTIAMHCCRAPHVLGESQPKAAWRRGGIMSKLNWGKRAYALLLLCAVTAIASPAQTFTALHSFVGTDGSYPYAGLVQATDGNFYGTTSQFGPGGNGYGTVFEITAGGVLTTLHSFDFTDGAYPWAGLVQATDGNFYGTTDGGGASSYGTVFKITAGGVLTTLHSFDSTDGANPQAGLVQATDGNFYGTTNVGGAIGYGTVFKITAGGVLTTLHSFDLTDGAWPQAGLVQATDGNFYGTTSSAGANGYGTVFKITAGGVLTTLHSFAGTFDGSWPYAGLVQATDGNFYGTTNSGGAISYGTVFSLSVGLGPFVETEPTSGKVGAAVIILGTNLTGATSVRFNGTTAKFTVVSSSEIKTTVPAGATTGKVSVVTPSGTLYSNTNFVVTQSALATSTALSSAPNPSNLGESVTFTAKVTVTPPGTGTPTGTVT